MPSWVKTALALICFGLASLAGLIAGVSAFIGFMAVMFGRGLSMELGLLSHVGYFLLPVIPGAVCVGFIFLGRCLQTPRS